MAGVRDPAFWKRFSYAVHLDEENAQRGDLKQSESWLARQQSKKNRRTRICWLFWIVLGIVIAAGVIAVIWLLNSGMLDDFGKTAQEKAQESASASAAASASASATAHANGSDGLGGGLAQPSASATPAPGGYRR